ncbi:ScyD/ScyE family protein [Arthrobacter sp. ZGTC131]|uniref:ScyD/ScyE family protein n=1 Tax=Arthrobacter sp. ZGTC131 TaxID=2058898 RepID=UPI000CE4DF1F|nr:ScyD/ScyE family protein [Arthrobacter sp. ZGTC131]
MKNQRSFVAAVAAASLLVSFAPAGQAAGDPNAAVPNAAAATVLAQGLLSPLHLSDGPDRSVLVSEEFAGRLTKVARDGAKSVVYENSAWNVAGTDRRDETIYLAESQGAGPMDPRALAGHLRSIDADGKQRTFGDLAALETKENADGGTLYGFRDLPGACAAQLPPEVEVSYKGHVDSHPYGIDVYGGTIYVADAGANSIVSVDVETGAAETVAVLPSRPHRFTAEEATALKLPGCIVGHTYEFEPVPTDVKRGPDGWLYVSVLPGGPEDPALGARGAVFKVDPEDGRVRLFADDVMSPTGLDMDQDGNVYVASLFGEGVLRLSADSGTQSVVLPGVLTADVDLRGETLYATVNALPEPNKAPDGRVVTGPAEND